MVGVTVEGTKVGLVGALLVGVTEDTTLVFVVGPTVELGFLVLGVIVGSLLLGVIVGSLLLGVIVGNLLLGVAVGIREPVFSQAIPELQEYVDLTVRDLTCTGHQAPQLVLAADSAFSMMRCTLTGMANETPMNGVFPVSLFPCCVNKIVHVVEPNVCTWTVKGP